jgi:hypothetical protein
MEINFSNSGIMGYAETRIGNAGPMNISSPSPGRLKVSNASTRLSCPGRESFRQHEENSRKNLIENQGVQLPIFSLDFSQVKSP